MESTPKCPACGIHRRQSLLGGGQAFRSACGGVYYWVFCSACGGVYYWEESAEAEEAAQAAERVE